MKLKLSTFLTISLLWLVSCQSVFPGYESGEGDSFYKYITIGEQSTNVNYGDYVTVNITYQTLADSMFFEAKRQFQVQKPQYAGSIDDCLHRMSPGDSAVFLIETEPFFKYTLLQEVPDFLTRSTHFKVNIGLIYSMPESQFLKEKAAFLAWIEDFAQYEKTRLSQYLEQEGRDFSTHRQGYYKMIISEGTGPKVKSGDTLVLNYEGRFMNGKVFDSTKQRKKTFEYIYGTEWQVIKGMELVVSQMQEGEHSVCILPSELAFGQDGNSNGAIPPYTTLIYEIELIDIRQK